jgi:mono/diheme cytochrome c family protein
MQAYGDEVEGLVLVAYNERECATCHGALGVSGDEETESRLGEPPESSSSMPSKATLAPTSDWARMLVATRWAR